MQAFLASDVIYQARVAPFIKNALTRTTWRARVATLAVHAQISLAAADVRRRAARHSSSPAAAATATTKSPTGPGLHGTGLDRHHLRRRDAPARHVQPAHLRGGQPFTVTFTNQGENDEFDIKVTVKITRASGGKPITLHEDGAAAWPRARPATVALPLNREPPLGAALTINVKVAAVPGEKKTDNNKVDVPGALRRRGRAVRARRLVAS